MSPSSRKMTSWPLGAAGNVSENHPLRKRTCVKQTVASEIGFDLPARNPQCTNGRMLIGGVCGIGLGFWRWQTGK